MKIIISSDHAGFETKEALVAYLQDNSYEVEDLGPLEYNSTDDYPDFIAPAMNILQKADDSLGIILCKNGVGVSMLANKFKGIRAGLCHTPEQAKSAKTDDNANVLALSTDYISQEDIPVIVDTFLNTPFSNGERHVRRLEKVMLVEEENFKQFKNIK